MMTRAPLCLLITGLFAAATLQGCYMYRTVDLGKHKDIIVVKTEPPNAKADIWKNEPSNIIGPSPQEVEFEYSRYTTELTWGYFTSLVASLSGLATGLYFGLREGGAFNAGYLGAAIAGAAAFVHVPVGATFCCGREPSNNTYSDSNTSFFEVGASYTDPSGAKKETSINIEFHPYGGGQFQHQHTRNRKPIVAVPYNQPEEKLPEVTLKIETPQGTAAVRAPAMQAPAVRPAAPVFRGPKSVVAVFDIQDTRKSRRLTPEQNADLTAYLITLLTNTKRYSTVPKSDLKAALTAQKAQSYDACYDESCQIDIGKEVAAEKSLATRISKLGKKCIIGMTMYDLRKSATENAVQDRVPCDVDSLLEAFEKLVPQLAKN